MNASRLLALFAVAAVAAPVCVPRAGFAADTDTLTVDKLTAWNRQAVAELQARRFDAARDILLQVLVVGKDAGLESHDILAQTHLHLGAVFLAGQKGRDKAIHQFMLALRINPAITLPPELESPAMKSAYLSARKQMGLPPHPELDVPHAAGPAGVVRPPGAPGRNRRARRPAPTVEPDPPARAPQPLYCPVPFEIAPKEPVTVRCLTQRAQNKSTAVLYYQTAGVVEFTAIPMARSAKGWLSATLPGDAVTGQTLAYYVEASVPGADGKSEEKLSFGTVAAPNHFSIQEETAEETAEDNGEEEDAPLREIQRKYAEDEDVRLFHRRLPGSVILGIGAGGGVGWHGREYVDSGARDASQMLNNVPIADAGKVAAPSGFAPASLFHLEVELGYQATKSLWISAFTRYQHTPKDALGGQHPDERSIRTQALAGFLRANYAFATHGNFQAYASAGIGGGRAFLLYFPKACAEATKDNACVLAHSDTVSAGGFAATAGLGALYHLSRWFGVFVDVKEIATLPRFMALTQVNLGVAFAYSLFDDSDRAFTDEESTGSAPPSATGGDR